VTFKRKRILFAQIAIAAFFALALTSSLFAQSTRYAQISNMQDTTSETPVPISGLTISLPAATTLRGALITLNMPNLFLEGISKGGTKGGNIFLFVDNVQVAEGQFSDDNTVPPGDGRKPMAIVVKVPLGTHPQTVEARWDAVRNSICFTDTFASLSAILTTN